MAGRYDELQTGLEKRVPVSKRQRITRFVGAATVALVPIAALLVVAALDVTLAVEVKTTWAIGAVACAAVILQSELDPRLAERISTTQGLLDIV